MRYRFLEGAPEQHKKVIDAIAIWERYANIAFLQVETAEAEIRIAFDPRKGAWSYIGNTTPHGPYDLPTMNLGPITPTSSLTDRECGVILHEFGHALGLIHEHQSPARKGVLTLKADCKQKCDVTVYAKLTLVILNSRHQGLEQNIWMGRTEGQRASSRYVQPQ